MGKLAFSQATNHFLPNFVSFKTYENMVIKLMIKQNIKNALPFGWCL